MKMTKKTNSPEANNTIFNTVTQTSITNDKLAESLNIMVSTLSSINN